MYTLHGKKKVKNIDAPPSTPLAITKISQYESEYKSNAPLDNNIAVTILFRIIKFTSIPQTEPISIKKIVLKPSFTAEVISQSIPANAPNNAAVTSFSNIEIHTTTGISKNALAPKIVGKRCAVFCSIAEIIIIIARIARRI